MNATVANTKRGKREEDSGAKNKIDTDDIVATKCIYCFIIDASSKICRRTIRLKKKACVNRKEPGQPLKISNNKTKSLI